MSDIYLLAARHRLYGTKLRLSSPFISSRVQSREPSSYFNVIFLGFQQGKTQIYVYGISVTFAVFVGWRQILRLERIIVYKLQRFLQYSMLYISWRNAYLYRDMNHTVYIGHFSTIHINPYTHNHALTHANFTCKFMWQSEY